MRPSRTDRSCPARSSLVSGEQNGAVNRLAVVSTNCLPPTFLTGFFGMNSTCMTDESEDRIVFRSPAVGLQAVVPLIARHVLHRTRRWRRLRDNGPPTGDPGAVGTPRCGRPAPGRSGRRPGVTVSGRRSGRRRHGGSRR
ncbi:CorA family divalent cation transporter [Streptomyces sp. NPDC046984]|uniref:CorA family divalent cation transporter n=1 Tax=unclassified Streptomyces TaxID=2593676 RepID=UPI003401516D